MRWTQNGKRRDVSAKTRSWAEAEKVKQKLLEKFGGGTPGPVRVDAEPRITLPGFKFCGQEAEKESKIVGGNGYRAWFIGMAPERT